MIAFAAVSKRIGRRFDIATRQQFKRSQMKLLGTSEVSALCRTDLRRTVLLLTPVVTTGAVYEVLFPGSIDITGVE